MLNSLSKLNKIQTLQVFRIGFNQHRRKLKKTDDLHLNRLASYSEIIPESHLLSPATLQGDAIYFIDHFTKLSGMVFVDSRMYFNVWEEAAIMDEKGFRNQLPTFTRLSLPFAATRPITCYMLWKTMLHDERKERVPLGSSETVACTCALNNGLRMDPKRSDRFRFGQISRFR